MNDVYYTPADYGLTIVDELDFSSGSYEFDLRMVWYHEATNTIYTARDSGCSCPSPFEDYSSLEDLDVVTGIEEFESELRSTRSDDYFSGTPSLSDQESFLRNVREALAKQAARKG